MQDEAQKHDLTHTDNTKAKLNTSSNFNRTDQN